MKLTESRADRRNGGCHRRAEWALIYFARDDGRGAGATQGQIETPSTSAWERSPLYAFRRKAKASGIECSR